MIQICIWGIYSPCSIVLSSFMTYHRVCNKINMTGVTSVAGTAYPSGAPEFTPGFYWGSYYSIFSFMCMFCGSLFVLLYFIFWPLYRLFFFDIQIVIIPFVSSNSSCWLPLIFGYQLYVHTMLWCKCTKINTRL